ncbi:MAG: hypothetical protein K9M10_03400 [Candidatus Pacebacteria bacterium]|nr:hypothetical protein [Candidatus Paceibacterota bacterium]MCF7857500.1 hypothetical protein [Candidatus Paceibacterota bacterium]
MRTHTNQDGITLLITLLLMGVLLGVSASLLSVTLKQYQLSGIAVASEIAFQAANAGLECAAYYDNQKNVVSPFEVNQDGITPQGAPAQISCMDVGTFINDAPSPGSMIIAGEQQHFQFTWGDPGVCTDISVWKFIGGQEVTVDGQKMRDSSGVDNECPSYEGVTCTVIQSRGYDVPCAQIGTSARVVEREYTQVY